MDPLEQARARWRWRGDARPPWAAVPGPGQESVWDYPRPPRVEADARRLVVRVGERVIAESSFALRVCETAGAPCFYLPPGDVDLAALEPAPGRSICEWKGLAVSWSARVDGMHVGDAAWSYPEPLEPYARLAGWLAFHPGRLDCFLDGERARAQAGGYYGGWITAELAGPIKGEPGTEGW